MDIKNVASLFTRQTKHSFRMYSHTKSALLLPTRVWHLTLNGSHFIPSFCSPLEIKNYDARKRRGVECRFRNYRKNIYSLILWHSITNQFAFKRWGTRIFIDVRFFSGSRMSSIVFRFFPGNSAKEPVVGFQVKVCLLSCQQQALSFEYFIW